MDDFYSSAGQHGALLYALAITANFALYVVCAKVLVSAGVETFAAYRALKAAVASSEYDDARFALRYLSLVAVFTLCIYGVTLSTSSAVDFANNPVERLIKCLLGLALVLPLVKLVRVSELLRRRRDSYESIHLENQTPSAGKDAL